MRNRWREAVMIVARDNDMSFLQLKPLRKMTNVEFSKHLRLYRVHMKVLWVGGLSTVTLESSDCTTVSPVFRCALHRILRVKTMPTVRQTRPKGLVGMFAGSCKKTREG